MRSRRAGLVATFAAVAVAVSACSGGDTVVDGTAAVVEGADGVETTITDTTRIVTLTGDLTEFVFELGLGGRIVATDVTTVYPEEAALLPKIGVGRFLNAESVLSFEPTLVIGDTQTSPPAAIEQIRATGVSVLITDVATSFDGMYEKVGLLGEALSVPDRADALAERIQTEVAAALATGDGTADGRPIAYLYTRGPDVMLLFGSGMTTSALIEAIGGVDAGSASGIDGTVNVTPEALVAAAPEVIIVPREGLEAFGGVAEFLKSPGIGQTPAGAAAAVLAYPEGDFLTFGPRVADSLRFLIADLQQLFPAS